MFVLTQIIMDQQMMYLHYVSLMKRTMIDGKVFTSLTLRERPKNRGQPSHADVSMSTPNERSQGSMQNAALTSGVVDNDADPDSKRRKIL